MRRGETRFSSGEGIRAAPSSVLVSDGGRPTPRPSAPRDCFSRRAITRRVSDAGLSGFTACRSGASTGVTALGSRGAWRGLHPLAGPRDDPGRCLDPGSSRGVLPAGAVGQRV
jgi:hypothetical protein